MSGQEEKVLVPALVGLEVSAAHELAFEARVVVVAADPDDPLPATGVVTAQAPAAGTRVNPAAGSPHPRQGRATRTARRPLREVASGLVITPSA